MSKPSWDSAPEWANWLAQDEDGTWVFFKDEPRLEIEGEEYPYWEAQNKSFKERGMSEVNGDWTKTLERKPARMTSWDMHGNKHVMRCNREINMTEEARGPVEMLKDLEERLGYEVCMRVHVDGSGEIQTFDEFEHVGSFGHFSEIDAWARFSDESPSEVEPGTEVLLKTGTKAYIFPGFDGCFYGMVRDATRDWVTLVWHKNGRCFTEGPDIDWERSRREGLI